MKPKPREPAPALDVQTLSNGPWRLAEQRPAHFTMITFYRGLHCPICKDYLAHLAAKVNEIAKRGVACIAISCDDQERASRTARDWGLQHLTLGYGLSISQGKEWGLYVSRAIKDDGPALFVEPGLALVSADGTLYAISIQSMPFARPRFEEVLSAVDFVIEHGYPARGEA